MKYLCFGYYDPKAFEALPKAELDALVSKCRTHDEALHQSGRLIAVGSLQRPGKSTSVRPRNGKSVVTDGPFTEAKEVIGAFLPDRGGGPEGSGGGGVDASGSALG